MRVLIPAGAEQRTRLTAYLLVGASCCVLLLQLAAAVCLVCCCCCCRYVLLLYDCGPPASSSAADVARSVHFPKKNPIFKPFSFPIMRIAEGLQI